MHHTKGVSVQEIKIQATRLLKQLRSESPEQAMLAALRFRRLRTFWQYPLQDLLLMRHLVKHKHALTVMALEHHYVSWAEMKQALERQELGSLGTTSFDPKKWAKLLLPKRCHGFLNHWYADYGSALAYQQASKGYLFPFREQFFVATDAYLTALGLDPWDQDVQTLQGNFAKPNDPEAFSRILNKLKQRV